MGTSSRTARDSVSVKTSTDRVIVDTTTGDVTPIVEVKGKFVFPGGFSFMGRVLRMGLRRANLPADGYRLALLLEEEANYSGMIFKPFKELATELGVHPSRISRLLSMLEKENVAQRVGNRQSGTILLNPTYHWRGNAESQHKAIEVWSANRPYNAIKLVRKSA
jgi:hypothetical protein